MSAGGLSMNVFIGAKRAGWLDAVRYYSSMSLRFMKAWSHWENIDRRWRAAPAATLPRLRAVAL